MIPGRVRKENTGLFGRGGRMWSQELCFGHKFSFLLSVYMEVSRTMLDAQIRTSKETSEIVI